MIDYVEAIKRPFSDFQKYAIGVLLYILPIISLLSLGYIIESAKLSIRRKNELPEWKDFGRLFITGLLTFIISFVYFIPLFIILLVGLGAKSFFQNFAYLATTQDMLDIKTVFSTLGPLVFLLVFLAILAVYLFPAAVLIFADTKKFGHAFNLGRVFEVAFSREYPGPWIIGIFIMVVLGAILGSIPYIGPAISSFTGGMIFYTILGQAYSVIRNKL